MMTKTNSTDVRGVSRLLATALVVGVALLQAAPKDLPRTFTSPRRLFKRPSRQPSITTRRLFSNSSDSDGKDIVESGDPAEDKEARAEFARSAHEQLQIDQDPLNPDYVTFTVGTGEWPFPVPVIRAERKMAT